MVLKGLAFNNSELKELVIAKILRTVIHFAVLAIEVVNITDSIMDFHMRCYSKD